MTRITVQKAGTLSSLVLDYENEYQAREALMCISQAMSLETVTIKFNHTTTPLEQPENA